MSGNSKNNSKATTSGDVVASGNAKGEAAAVTGSLNGKSEAAAVTGSLNGKGEAAAVTSSLNAKGEAAAVTSSLNGKGEAAAVTGSLNRQEDTNTLVKALEEVIQTLEGEIDTKECSEISSMILTELLPKAEAVQAKINEGVMKNSDTDSIKGKLSTIIQSVKGKCITSSTRKNNTGKPSSMNTKKNNSKPPSAKPAKNEAAREEKVKTNSKTGSKYDYGYLGFTKIDKLKPLYSEYLAKKQGTETFGEYVQRSYIPKVPMKGGLSMWKKTAKNNSSTKQTANITQKEIITGELMKQFKLFLSSKYVKSLALEKEPTFAEYIDDRYTPKLEGMKIEADVVKPIASAVAGQTSSAAAEQTPSAVAEGTPPKVEVPDVESYWTVDTLSKDKSIGFKAIVQIKKVSEKEISYVITDVIESGTTKEVKVGDTRDIFATSWKDLKKTLSGGPTQATSNLAKKPEEIIPVIGSIWELDRTDDTMASPEKKYKAKITVTAADQTTIQYGITMMKKSGSAPLGMKEDTMPFSKWAQLLREKKITPASAGGGRRTKKQKRKISKRKTRSRRRV